MQQITIVLTTAKGVVIKKTLIKPEAHPVQLSLPPGAQIAVEVQGPNLKQTASANSGAKKLQAKRFGDDLVIEGEGEKLVSVTDYYSTKDVSIGTLQWDPSEPIVQPATPTASTTTFEGRAAQTATPVETVAAADTATAATTASAAAARSSGSMGWLALGLGLAGGGGGGGGGSAVAPSNVGNTLSGVITAGPVVSGNNLSANVYRADGTLIGAATIDSSGRFTANVGNYSGVVIVKVTSSGSTSGDFKDEATGINMHLDATLLAVGQVSASGGTLNVNPLTTVVARKAGVDAAGKPPAQLDTATIAQANTVVSKALGLSGDIHQLSAQTSLNAKGETQNPNEVGAILAAISGMASKGTQQTAINDLINAIGADGSLASSGLEKLIEGARTSDPSNTVSKLLNNLVNRGASSDGFSIDKLGTNGDNVLTSGALIAGTSRLTGHVAPGTASGTLSLKWGTTTITSAAGLTVDATNATWQYVLKQADIDMLLGGITQRKDGPESISLCVDGKTKTVLSVFYNNGTDDAPVAVTFANTTTTLAENVDTSKGIKLADIVITDPDGYKNGVPSVNRSSTGKFEIRTNANGKFELWLVNSATLNYDTAQSLVATVTAGSTTSQAFTLNITNVNYAPLASGVASLAAIDEDNTSPSGAAVSSLFGGNYSNGGHDANDTLKGIAVSGNTANSTTQGAWQYSSDGTSWADVGAVSDSSALYLDANTLLRFVPVSNYNGTPDVLSAHLVDSSASGLTTGNKINASINGGVTALSSGTVNLGTVVNAVNDPPTVVHPLQNQILVADDVSQTFMVPVDAFADIDSPQLTYSAVLVNSDHSTRSLPNDWLTFDPASRTFTAHTASTGSYLIRVTASDGSLSASSDFTLTTISASMLAPPSVSLEKDTGNDSTDGITSDGVVLVSGLALGATWQYSLNGGKDWSTGTGNSFTLGSNLTYNIKVKQTYGGNTSEASPGFTVKLDTHAPDSTILGFDKAGLITDGIVSGSALTDTVGAAMTHTSGNKSALLIGTTEADATITFTMGGQSHTATADSTGYWNYRLTDADFANVGFGAETITITSATDRAGNVNSASVTHNVTFNATADTTSYSDPGGSTYIDALVHAGAGWKNGATISYSFGPASSGSYAWTDIEKQAFVNAFQVYENICNLHFVEGAFIPNEYECTNIVLYKVAGSTWQTTSSGGTVLADFNLPTNGFNEYYGPLFGRFNKDFSAWTDLTPGGLGFDTIIHELGHGLGLDHPFDASPTFPGVSDYKNLGNYNLDQGIWTVMAYNHGWPNTSRGDETYGFHYGYSKTPMTFDVAALQALYGANTNYQSGDNTYTLPTVEVSGTGWQCIWDTGGNDTISNADSSIACTINLNAYPKTGGVTSEPYVSYAWGAGIAGGFTIADGVVIENAIGGSGSDVITGNAADNTLSGGRGNDSLTGGAGADHFVFNTALNASSNVDTITDFSVSQGDKIDLSAAIFTKLSVSIGVAATQFKSGAGQTTASDADDYLIYNTTDGSLYYDSDGSGSAAAVLFAVLSNKPTDLSNTQFVVI